MEQALRTQKGKVFIIRKKMKRNDILNNTIIKLWTEEEDKLLIQLNSQYKKKKWISISKHFQDKSVKDCMLRFLKINPKIKKGKWTFEEDRKLIYLIKEFGTCWAFISKVLKNRNHKQVRSRFYHYFIKYREVNSKNIRLLEQSLKDNQIPINFSLSK